MRNRITGKFSKPLYELFLQDLKNMGLQLVEVSESKQDLKTIADRLNQAFGIAGQSDQWVAEVHESNESSVGLS